MATAADSAVALPPFAADAARGGFELEVGESPTYLIYQAR